eukprot:CAMPEP_0194527638 /NCGR_PEP_ID=MMETSP0253-20130528/63799_1 /TAXON_ID=2966 /ORGANISM="Noctiluca scintillans" /LENGTH=225 /DNA_ID=CAMNT_0039372605 /DNA_START=169 /DNA_END=847 /DNA_ORIENTATION=+
MASESWYCDRWRDWAQHSWFSTWSYEEFTWPTFLQATAENDSTVEVQLEVEVARGSWLPERCLHEGLHREAKEAKFWPAKSCLRALSNGRVVKSYIPGIGHNLQVHSVVMVRGGRHRDVIGCNYTCMRGHYDLLPVKGRLSRRSKYGVSMPTDKDPRRGARRKRFKTLFTAVDRRLYFYRTGIKVEAEEAEANIVPGVKHIVRNTPPITFRHSSYKKDGGKNKSR